jgi:hypothetical protein
LVIVSEVLHHIYYNRRTVWGPASLPNKGGWSRVLLVRRWRPSWGRSFLIWPEWGVPDCRRMNVTVYLCLKFAGWGGIRSCTLMLLFRLFGSRGCGTKLRSFFAIRWYLVHGEVRDGEYHEGQIGGLAIKFRVCSGFCSSTKVGAAAQVKFKVLPFNGKSKVWP